ncbi:hypothetical protein IM40_07305 [Candidatus Paracaedimonas acanthamoebae]|nr:hypothetical protein IM40_07305 [Candidatus Paracaedimonas acanthamoebae]
MLLTIGTLVFLLNIDYTAVNLALLPISEEIECDLNSLQRLLSGYVLTWGAVVVPAGRLADLYGRKNVLIAGLIIFMIGSILTGAGHHISFLIGGRILQGIGAAVFTAPAMSLIFTTAPLSQQGLAMGIISSLGGFGLATGPTFAGWIIKSFGWRWLFYINIPLSLFVIVIIFYLTPKNETSSSSPKVDKGNALLLSCGLGSFMFALNQIEVWGAQDLWFWGLLTLGCVLLIIFALRDKNSLFQTFPYTLLKNKAFMSTGGAIFGTAYCFSLILIMIALYLQNTLKMNSLETGYIFLAMTLSVGLLSPIGGKLVDLIDIRIPLISAFILLFSALLLMSFFSETTSMIFILIALFLAGLGIGFNFPAMNTAMFRTIEPTDINTGSAVFVMCAMLGNTFAIIVSTNLIVILGRSELTTLLNQYNIVLTSPEYEQLISIINKVEHTAQQLSGFAKDKIPHLLHLIDLAFLNGMRITMWIGMGLTLLSAILVCKFLKLKATAPSSQHMTTHF